VKVVKEAPSAGSCDGSTKQQKTAAQFDARSVDSTAS